MKLRYYLRGLGIGIVVTAIVMSFTGKKEELTDAEIKIRATQLGMVEKSVLADIQKENESNKETNKEETPVENVPEAEHKVDEENVQHTTENSEETNVQNATENSEETNVQNTTENSEETNVQNTTENPEDTVSDTNVENVDVTGNVTNVEDVENYIVISVNQGNGSEIVSQRVFEAGLVNSALDYNKYLVTNGYDRRLRVGNHEIPVGATEEEIAKILCGMK